MNYKVYSMTELNKNCSSSEIDGFIFFDTKENRARNVFETLKSVNKLPKQVFTLYLENTDSTDEFSDNHNLEYTLRKFGICSDPVDSLLPCLIAINEYISNREIIGIDISVMPTPIFYQILHFLVKKHIDKRIIIYYTEPSHYYLDNLFDYKLNDGEIDIKSIPGFEGKTSQENETQRVILYLLGFEMNYLNKLIPQQTNPDQIVPINGFPSYFPKYKDISLINNNVNYHESDIQVIFAEAFNPFETYNQISTLCTKYNTYCIDIIPAGSKPMALGACLFALRQGNNAVRVLFPYPTKYENQITFGSGKIWEYSI